MFKLRASFLQAIIAVGGMVAGNKRAEDVLWFLMKLIRATYKETFDLASALMRDEDKHDQELSE